MKTRFLILFFFAIAISQNIFAQNYSQVQLNLSQHELSFLYQNEIFPLRCKIDRNNVLTGIFEQKDLQKLTELGLKYQVIIDNLTEYYVNRNKQPDKGSINPNNFAHVCSNRPFNAKVPSLFSLGSMGGYYTYSEALALLDTLKQRYPSLITAKQEVSTIHSIENRPIYYVKISDNANVDENEPEVLYTSIHHSQEPCSMQQLMFFMMYLLENYGTDEEVTYLVNNLELYFVPFVNPDGYVYNQTQNPNGGGLWRKNRRDNGWLSYGVDLNRNYGYKWGYDNIGSHNIGSSPWYRGTAAFSEPETQAMKSFIESRHFRMALNWHSYGNFIIFPWNYINVFTPDSAQFMEYSKEITATNHYRFGTVAETYGYQSNGDADDWAYGEVQSKPKIISLTAEIGSESDGFWPDTSRIIPLCREAVDLNLKFASLNLPYARVIDKSSELISGNYGAMPFDVICLGIDTPSNFTLSFVSLSPNLLFLNNNFSFSNMSLLEKRSFGAYYQIIGTPQQGQEIKFVININNGLRILMDTVTKILGQHVVLAFDNCENNSHWAGDDWNFTTEKAYSGLGCITDSPNNTYGLLTTSTYVYQDTFDLTGYQKAWISFMAQWDIERYFDYVKVEASTDFGNTWTALCASRSSFGSDDLATPEPVYDGRQPDWVREEISLNDYLGQQVMIRFRLKSDQTNGNYDGFYFDDFAVYAIPDNTVSSYNSSTTSVCRIYPNPAKDKLFVEKANDNDVLAEIRDARGTLVYASKQAGKRFSIPLHTLPQGVYTIRLSANDVATVHKIVKL